MSTSKSYLNPPIIEALIDFRVEASSVLTLLTLEDIKDTIYLPAHGFNTGDPVCLTGAALPNGIPSGNFYFIGSITTNSFTLHQLKADALSSINGQTINPINLSSTGSGSATLTVQNVQITSVVNTGSTLAINWSSLSANNIDASNLVSGIINTSRFFIL